MLHRSHGRSTFETIPRPSPMGYSSLGREAVCGSFSFTTYPVIFSVHSFGQGTASVKAKRGTHINPSHGRYTIDLLPPTPRFRRPRLGFTRPWHHSCVCCVKPGSAMGGPAIAANSSVGSRIRSALTVSSKSVARTLPLLLRSGQARS